MPVRDSCGFGGETTFLAVFPQCPLIQIKNNYPSESIYKTDMLILKFRNKTKSVKWELVKNI